MELLYEKIQGYKTLGGGVCNCPKQKSTHDVRDKNHLLGDAGTAVCKQ